MKIAYFIFPLLFASASNAAVGFDCSAKCNYRIREEYSKAELARFPVATALSNDNPTVLFLTVTSQEEAIDYMKRTANFPEGEMSYCHHHASEIVVENEQTVELGVDLDGKMDIETIDCHPAEI